MTPPKTVTLREIAATYGVSYGMACGAKDQFERAATLPARMGRRPFLFTARSVAAAATKLGWKRRRADGGRS